MIRLGFAYVSNSGLDALLSELEGTPGWESSRKEWIVCLHRGTTEPSALERIRSLRNSFLRVFWGAGPFSSDCLTGREVFHAKVVCVATQRGKKTTPVLLFAGSANLTGAAISESARNYEAGIFLFGRTFAKAAHTAFRDWWRSAWGMSHALSDALLQRYTRLRDRYLTRNPDALAGMDPPSLCRLQDARTLWIEAGAMSGGSRNQVEFNQELAAFFGPVKRRRRLLRIRSAGREWTDRPLSHKVTTFGVEIWRLSLPTEGTGGFTYPGKIIRFRKLEDSNGVLFQIDLADASDRRSALWRTTASRFGYLGMTSGQRAYGFQ